MNNSNKRKRIAENSDQKSNILDTLDILEIGNPEVDKGYYPYEVLFDPSKIYLPKNTTKASHFIGDRLLFSFEIALEQEELDKISFYPRFAIIFTIWRSIVLYQNKNRLQIVLKNPTEKSIKSFFNKIDQKYFQNVTQHLIDLTKGYQGIITVLSEKDKTYDIRSFFSSIEEDIDSLKIETGKNLYFTTLDIYKLLKDMITSDIDTFLQEHFSHEKNISPYVLPLHSFVVNYSRSIHDIKNNKISKEIFMVNLKEHLQLYSHEAINPHYQQILIHKLGTILYSFVKEFERVRFSFQNKNQINHKDDNNNDSNNNSNNNNDHNNSSNDGNGSGDPDLENNGNNQNSNTSGSDSSKNNSSKSINGTSNFQGSLNITPLSTIHRYILISLLLIILISLIYWAYIYSPLTPLTYVTIFNQFNPFRESNLQFMVTQRIPFPKLKLYQKNQYHNLHYEEPNNEFSLAIQKAILKNVTKIKHLTMRDKDYFNAYLLTIYTSETMKCPPYACIDNNNTYDYSNYIEYPMNVDGSSTILHDSSIVMDEKNKYHRKTFFWSARLLLYQYQLLFSRALRNETSSNDTIIRQMNYEVGTKIAPNCFNPFIYLHPKALDHLKSIDYSTSVWEDFQMKADYYLNMHHDEGLIPKHKATELAIQKENEWRAKK